MKEIKIDDSKTHVYFKYREFSSTFWSHFFSDPYFWFSVKDKLDDEEELSFDFLGYESNESNIKKLQSSTSILSLGRTCDNQDLWARYGGQSSGFCLEVDFATLDGWRKQDAMTLVEVEYVENAKIEFDMSDALWAMRAPDEFKRYFYKVFFASKNRAKWSQQEEVRFLHYEKNNIPNYKGMKRKIAPKSIKSVYYYGEFISENNLTSLKDSHKKFNEKFKENVRLIDLSQS